MARNGPKNQAYECVTSAAKTAPRVARASQPWALRQNPVGIPRLRSIVCAEVFEDFGAEFVAVHLAVVAPQDVAFGVDE